MMREVRPVVIVTGMSGAGKTTALKVLEDLGYEVIDNLPLALLPSLAQETDPNRPPLAVGVDARTRGFDGERLSAFCDALLREDGVSGRIVFLDCDDGKLLRRFTETRRSHPLAKNKSVSEGLAQERRLMEPLRSKADFVIDTTDLKPADLRHYIEKHFAPGRSGGMVVSVMSFSFRQGLPGDADLVFDVRFLRNPFYEPALRPLTGRDGPIADYVAADPEFDGFFERLTGFIEPLLPRFAREGKSYLTIAVGCTGGRHRSVFTAERLYAWLLAKKEYTVTLTHRELDK
ncbi:MAG: RNase adapter RapZ [Alphaproteobacteria bacterium]